MNIKISTDSACDLSNKLIEQNNIAVIPLTVIMGDDAYLDGINVTPEQIFDFVKTTGILPKTSAPSEEEYISYFKPLLEKYDTIIHVSISSKASSSCETATRAAQNFGGRVHVVDSKALSTGQGLIVMKACDLVREGKTAKEIVKILEELRPKVNTSFVPETLDYLYKGGRCSLTSLVGAKVLKIYPMIDMKDGQLYAKKKYMGKFERCLKIYVSDLAETYKDYDDTRCFITHSHCEKEVADGVRALVESTFNFKEIIETYAGGVVTSHCGKNTIGVLFISK